MQIELNCQNCGTNFTASPDAPAEETIDRMIEDGLWYGLGEGATFEDMIFASLTDRGGIYCPGCGEQVSVQEESLGRLAMEVLNRW